MITTELSAMNSGCSAAMANRENTPRRSFDSSKNSCRLSVIVSLVNERIFRFD
jgi:hypothetical protein